MGNGLTSSNTKKKNVVVQEEDDTFLNLQISGDVDHIDENRITKAGLDILHDFIETCDFLATDEKIVAIRAKYEELLTTHPVPIRYMRFNDFVAHGGIPHFPHVDLTCTLNSINRDESLVIFVSQAEGNIGNSEIEKDIFVLCVNGIKKLWSKYASSMKECYLWIEQSCVEVRDKTRDSGASSEIIRHCDVLFTPVLDSDTAWDYGCSENCLENYQAKAWKDGSTSYLSGGRTRLEFLYGACLPTVCNESGDRYNLFALELAFHCKVGRRMHVIYGTKENATDRYPFVLDAMNQQSFIEAYNPEEGSFQRESDCDYVTTLMDKLRPLIHEAGYFGERNKQGQYHGRGLERYSNGDTYRGEFNRGVKEGHGVLVTTHWVYEGQWKGDKMTDTSCMMMQSNGTVYEGEVREGVWHGDGYVTLPNGDSYEGAFEEGLMCGHGVYRYACGDVYEGEFKNNLRDGMGMLTYTSGKVCEGEFQEGTMVHGAVRLPNGDIYEGDLENDHFHGSGKMHFNASGDVYEGEFCLSEISGKGIYVCPNKEGKFDIYVGTLDKGIRNGVGTLTNSDGRVEKGLWMNGNLVLNLEKNNE